MNFSCKHEDEKICSSLFGKKYLELDKTRNDFVLQSHKIFGLKLKMEKLKIQIYKPKNAEQPHKTVTLPLSPLSTGLLLLPEEIKQNLKAEGIDLSYSKELIKEKDITGTLIEIENVNRKIVISVE